VPPHQRTSNTVGYPNFWYGGTGLATATAIPVTADTTINFTTP
jgi:hypothetical protein